MKISDQHGHQLSRTRIFHSCSRPREYFLHAHSWSVLLGVYLGSSEYLQGAQILLFGFFSLWLIAQQVHCIETTSYQRRCDVVTSHRCWYNVVLRLCAYWVIVKTCRQLTLPQQLTIFPPVKTSVVCSLICLCT